MVLMDYMVVHTLTKYAGWTPSPGAPDIMGVARHEPGHTHLTGGPRSSAWAGDVVGSILLLR